jgi:hypothetical protein
MASHRGLPFGAPTLSMNGHGGKRNDQGEAIVTNIRASPADPDYFRSK